MKKQIKYGLLGLVLLFTVTGCTTYMRDEDGKTVINPTTGQSLPENILCRPTDEETIKLYEENGYDLTKLPSCVCKDENIEKQESDKEEEATPENSKENAKEEKETNEEENTDALEKDNSCEEFSITSGEYDGLWSTIFVKPLAYVILLFGKWTGSFGVGLIITSIIIRLIVFPLTRKSTVQAEQMKNIQPEMEKIEKKYANKDQNDREVMMQKSQEMMMLYKKYNVNPISGCLPALLQLPLFIAFLDAINRVPAIFEEKFLWFHLGTTPSIGIQNGNYWYIILTVLVAVTTYFSMNKAQSSSSGSDPSMAKQTKMMMNIFTIMIIVMSIFMSSALNIYWVTSNICTLVQNYLVKRSMK